MKELRFDEENHKYYDDKNRLYTSVTTLIDKYKEEFDKEFWGMYTALKNNGYAVKPDTVNKVIRVAGRAYKITDLLKDKTFNILYQQTLLSWELTTLDACNRGNTIHNELEDNINISKGGSKNLFIDNTGNKIQGIINDLSKTNLKEKYPEVYIRLSGYIERGFTVFSEKRVHLENYLVAGTIDVPLIKDNKFCILDWKTNKDELHKTSGYYRKIKVGNEWIKSNEWVETNKCFNYPLNNVQASKFNTYALQLSTYAYILEQWGYELIPNGLEIIHFRPNLAPILIKVPYLKKEVELMLKDNLNNIKIQ